MSIIRCSGDLCVGDAYRSEAAEWCWIADIRGNYVHVTFRTAMLQIVVE